MRQTVAAAALGLLSFVLSKHGRTVVKDLCLFSPLRQLGVRTTAAGLQEVVGRLPTTLRRDRSHGLLDILNKSYYG